MIRTLAFAAASLLSQAAHAQTASVTVSHDDPDGLVNPCQTVRITATVSRDFGIQIAGVAGDLVASPDVGVASNIAYNHPMGPTINPGSLSGAGLVGYDVASLPPFFLGGMPIPPWYLSEFVLFSYDWTAPASPGEVEFAFVPRAAAPNIRVYLSGTSAAFVEAESFDIPTMLTVVPSPGSAILLLGAGAAIPRRRRA